MELLADENADTTWVRALRDDGHDVVRVVGDSELGESAPDSAVLARASARDRVLLTADRSDFGDPPTDDHAGIVLVTASTRSGAEVRRGLRRIEGRYPSLEGCVAYVGDWL